MLTRDQMLQALLNSQNASCRIWAEQITRNEVPIEYALRYTGSFMTAVLKGDYKLAMLLADYQNKQALQNYEKTLL